MVYDLMLPRWWFRDGLYTQHIEVCHYLSVFQRAAQLSIPHLTPAETS